MTRSKRTDARVPARARVLQLLEQQKSTVPVGTMATNNVVPPPPTTIIIDDDDDDVRFSSRRSFRAAKSLRRAYEERFAADRGLSADDQLVELRLGLHPQLPVTKAQNPSGPAGADVTPTRVLRRNLPIDLTSPPFDADCILVNEFKKRKPQVAAQVAPAPPEAPKDLKLTCAICMDTMKRETSTTCGHLFCASCIEGSLKVQKKCPTCRVQLTAKNIHRIYLSSGLR